MTAMTFESISASPRRTAVRRNYRATVQVIAIPWQPPVAAILPPLREINQPRNRKALIVAIGIVLALHVAVIIKGNQPMEVAPFERKVPQMSMEIAPPPPPPLNKPKPLPRIVKAAPPPSMPVVRQADTDVPSPDAVQVAVAEPPAPVVAKPAPPAERLLSADDFLVKPRAAYPPAAQKQKLQGRVTLKFHVLPNGQVDNVVIAKSSGYDILDDEAVKTIRAAVLPPATRGNMATDALYTYSFNFKLS